MLGQLPESRPLPNQQPSDSVPIPTPEAPPLKTAALAWDALDQEAAARLIASETPRGSDQLQTELVWTQVRSALARGQSLYQRITAGSGWGKQGESDGPGPGSVRPVATSNPATAAQRELARRILDGELVSQFEGAKKFFEPASQDKLFALGQKARAKQARKEKLSEAEKHYLLYKRTAQEVRDSWARDSQLVGSMEGVEFWT